MYPHEHPLNGYFRWQFHDAYDEVSNSLSNPGSYNLEDTRKRILVKFSVESGLHQKIDWAHVKTAAGIVNG